MSGIIAFRPVESADAPLLGAWLRDPASSFWQMQDITDDGARAYLRGIQEDGSLGGWMAEQDGRSLAYLETYDPAVAVLTEVFDAEPGDLGMHLLVEPAPRDRRERRPGLTSEVMRAAVVHCTEALGARRIVVEPDVGNTAIAVKNAEVGFRVLREVQLPGKRAALSLLDASTADSARAVGTVQATPRTSAGAAADDVGDPRTAHLAPEYMEPAQRHLVAKALSEFFHERLLVVESDEAPAPPATSTGTSAPDEHPNPAAAGSAVQSWRAETGAGTVYRFHGELLPLRHLNIAEESIVRHGPDGAQLPVDVQELVLDLESELGIPDHLLGTYLEELASTAAGGAYKQYRGGPSALQLARGRRDLDPAGDFQHTEAAMTEGHPCFVASNGRIGFGVSDYLSYAPETGRSFRYAWYAARREHTHLALTPDRSEDEHWEAELDADTRRAFAAEVSRRGGDPADYIWVPVHPWQHDHRIAVSFAPDIARGDLIPLGRAGQRYQPQQSIRTAFPAASPERSYVKTSLSIQNMGFLRGLSPAYMRATPAINAWVAEVVRGDPRLCEAGFDVLREHAALGYTGDAYHRTEATSAQQKMLAALWRESPLPRIGHGERLMTLAALLHRDARGRPVVRELIELSGTDAVTWVGELLTAYVAPVLRCLEVHELAFMAHGENVILRLREGRVVGALMKDIGEEAAVIGDRPLPDGLNRMRHPIDDAEAAQLIFTDILDGVLRHLQAILQEAGVLGPQRFWEVLGEVVADHRAEPGERRRLLDLHVPRFAHSCLNRLQLRNTLQMVDIQDAAASMIHVAELENPLASARQHTRATQ